jgi:hypothetical protein
MPACFSALRKYDRLLRMLPAGCVFDGEIVVLDADGRPVFNRLLFGRGDPVYVTFGNFGGSYTPGNRTAETALPG